MYFDLADTDRRGSYKLLSSVVLPRPIAWVVTANEGERINLAPFSFFNVFSGDPPIVCLGIGRHADGRPKDTLINLRMTSECVINLASSADIAALNVTAIPFPPDVDEAEMARLTTSPSRMVAPPRLAGSAVSLECRSRQIIDLDGPNHLVILDVLGLHVTDDAVTDRTRYRIDASRLDPIGRMESPGWYVRTSDRFSAPPPSLERWQAGQAALDQG